MQTIVICNSIDETHKLAKEFFSKLNGGEIIGLNGELGAGKTEFVRGLAKCMNGNDDVSSPSFVLQNIYTVTQTNNPTSNSNSDLNSKLNSNSNSNIAKIYHWDIYRVADGLSVNELLEGKQKKNSITLIEWAEKSEELQKLLDYNIQIEILETHNITSSNLSDDAPRKITVEKNIS